MSSSATACAFSITQPARQLAIGTRRPFQRGAMALSSAKTHWSPSRRTKVTPSAPLTSRATDTSWRTTSSNVSGVDPLIRRSVDPLIQPSIVSAPAAQRQCGSGVRASSRRTRRSSKPSYSGQEAPHTARVLTVGITVSVREVCLLGQDLQPHPDESGDQEDERQPGGQQERVAGEHDQNSEEDRVATEAVHAARDQARTRSFLDSDPPRCAELELSHHEEGDASEQHRHPEHRPAHDRWRLDHVARRQRFGPCRRHHRLTGQEEHEDHTQRVSQLLLPACRPEEPYSPAAIPPTLPP